MSYEDRGTLRPTPLKQSLPRLAVRFIAIGIIVYGILSGFTWLTEQIMKLEGTAQSGAMIGLLAIALIGYAVVIAIPFMPGVEIGVALLVMEGAKIAPFVYLATLSGLVTAFLIGQFVSLDWLHGVFRDLRFIRVCRWLDRIKSQPRHDRLAALTDRLPRWLAWIAVDYRYITIALLLSLPGSIAIGGGGGIMMLAGLSRLFHTGWMIVTLIFAVLPIPLAVWIMGTDILK
ncbi:MAG: hypothetical protein AAF926_08085 [Pseudomonadota bacterium]